MFVEHLWSCASVFQAVITMDQSKLLRLLNQQPELKRLVQPQILYSAPTASIDRYIDSLCPSPLRIPVL
jgi:hypothetical protein